jgi:protein-tyrosine phosphatase
MKEENCAFQYYDGVKMACDKNNLTLTQAKELWNAHYDDMIDKVKQGRNIEVAIWINMEDDNDYSETLVHLDNPRADGGVLYATCFFGRY